MSQTNFREFAIDNASILFLSLIRPYHNNNFRFSVELRKPVQPDILQQAVDAIHPRFPSVIAGFRQNFLHFTQVAAEKAPTVQPDPGLLLPMDKQELRHCAFRVYYRENTISIELFHALTDGHGTLTVLTALIREYLRLLGGDGGEFAPLGTPQPFEVTDAYEAFSHVPPKRLPSRFSYLLPRAENADWQVRASHLTLDTKPLLDAAHRYGVTLNTLLTTLLAKTVMEMQLEDPAVKRMKPVRIMVPADIRKLNNSRTLRNCALYALPTMEVSQKNLDLRQLCEVFSAQFAEQLSPESLAAMASANVRIQKLRIFNILPWKLKAAALRLGYRFFGESNSSLTLTNLGRVTLPEELNPHVADLRCYMTPRVTSPYGCTIMTFGDKLTLNMSSFCPDQELTRRYFEKILSILE